MTTLKTRRITIISVSSFVLLITCWVLMKYMKDTSGINFQVTGLREPWLAGSNTHNIFTSNGLGDTILENSQSAEDAGWLQSSGQANEFCRIQRNND